MATKKSGGSAGSSKKVSNVVNAAVAATGKKLSSAEKKFVDNLITKASQTGKGISIAEQKVIVNEAVKQATDKNKGVAQSKTSNLYKFLEDQKKKLAGSGGGEASGSASSPAPEPPAMQTLETFTPSPPPPVRVPERDVVELATETIDAETIQNLLFENIGANELTKFLRHDTVEGINPYYDIISNLTDIKRQFDPSNIISLQKTNASFFDIYPIKLEYKIPDDVYLAANGLSDYVYIDTNGDLVIEVVNMQDFEVIEVQIDTNGTIYEVEEL